LPAFESGARKINVLEFTHRFFGIEPAELHRLAPDSRCPRWHQGQRLARLADPCQLSISPLSEAEITAGEVSAGTLEHAVTVDHVSDRFS
jgi:hypothetical protein